MPWLVQILNLRLGFETPSRGIKSSTLLPYYLIKQIALINLNFSPIHSIMSFEFHKLLIFF
jgi:hypothetical protein